MKHLKQTAYNFLKKFKITDLNVHTLSDAITKQGYTIVEYSRISNQEDVEQLLDALGVKALSLTTGAFTYADKNYRIVFIEEGHSDDELLILLAHEEGHIFCGHLNNNCNVIGDSVLNEQEANTFAHYLLKKDFLRSVKLYASVNKLKTALICCIFALVIGMICTLIVINSKPAVKYFRSYNGDCYHQPECITVSDSKGVYDTAANFKKNNIRPCKVCLPDSE